MPSRVYLTLTQCFNFHDNTFYNNMHLIIIGTKNSTLIFILLCLLGTNDSYHFLHLLNVFSSLKAQLWLKFSNNAYICKYLPTRKFFHIILNDNCRIFWWGSSGVSLGQPPSPSWQGIALRFPSQGSGQFTGDAVVREHSLFCKMESIFLNSLRLREAAN